MKPEKKTRPQQRESPGTRTGKQNNVTYSSRSPSLQTHGQRQQGREQRKAQREKLLERDRRPTAHLMRSLATSTNTYIRDDRMRIEPGRMSGRAHTKRTTQKENVQCSTEITSAETTQRHARKHTRQRNDNRNTHT